MQQNNITNTLRTLQIYVIYQLDVWLSKIIKLVVILCRSYFCRTHSLYLLDINVLWNHRSIYILSLYENRVLFYCALSRVLLVNSDWEFIAFNLYAVLLFDRKSKFCYYYYSKYRLTNTHTKDGIVCVFWANIHKKQVENKNLSS